MLWYYKLLAQRPYLILLFTGTFCVACIVVSLTTQRFPDFSDPTLGFEARGTELGQRMTAWHNLLEETSPQGQLVSNPYEYLDYDELQQKQHPLRRHHHQHHKHPKWNKGRHEKQMHQQQQQRKKGHKNRRKMSGDKILAIMNNETTDQTEERRKARFRELPETDDYDDYERHYEYGRNISFLSDDVAANQSIADKRGKWVDLTKQNPPPYVMDINTSSDGFFCESPNEGYSHLVMERINYNVNESMFEMDALLLMCDLERKLIATESYGDYCVRDMNTDECCRPWSIPNYVTRLVNKTNCFDIDVVDVEYVNDLLIACFPYYQNMRLGNDCGNTRCRNVPQECTHSDAVYNIFHYLADSQFMKPNETRLFLRKALLFLPIAKSTKILPFYHKLAKRELFNQLINIPAMDMGLKNALFDECLISDGWLVALSGTFVVLCMCFYTASVFITAMTIVAILFSLAVSYFIYVFIFELAFFPFMNILAVIVIVGIGADDAFVFIKLWQCSISEKVKANGSYVVANASPSSETAPMPALMPANPYTATGMCQRIYSWFQRQRPRRQHRQPITSAAAAAQQRLTAAEPEASTSIESRNSANLCRPAATTTDSLSGLMANTLRSAALSMAVTSVTTAAAFYASAFSSITAVRCFGIFAGTAVLVNYLLMVTWLPASVSIAERLSCSVSFCSKMLTTRIHKALKAMRSVSDGMEKHIINAIVKMPYLWIGLFGTIGVLSGIVVFYWPGLQLPTSADFKLFVASHPFEVYDSQYKSQFWFERSFSPLENYQFPLRFVWGVKPVDNGRYLNPASRGELVLDPSFNISLPESQTWLLQFCKDIREQPFYQASFGGGMLPNCFVENFYEFMKRRCIDKMADIDRTPCCETSSHPYEPHIFDECLPHSISSLYSTPRELFIPGVAGPKFRRHDNNNNLPQTSPSLGVASNRIITTNDLIAGRPPAVSVAAAVVEFESIQANTRPYAEIRQFVATVEAWLEQQRQTAPASMKSVFFVSELDFFDLQNTLASGTWVAVCLSMGIALVVLFAVTLNVMISLYAIVTVTMTICTTVAILVGLGWELNVLESVAVSTVIGLAVDFSLHYGVHYRFSPERSRLAATRFALRRMIGPTAMAATTTAAAGIFMLPSQVLAYIQIGLFLVVVMLVSWLYATFFLMSVLLVGGPEYGYGQFQYPSCGSWLCRGGGVFRGRNKGSSSSTSATANKTADSNSGTSHNPVSEQLLSASSSGAGDMVGSESHELDSLASNSVVKPPSQAECLRPINFDRAFKKSTSQSFPEQSPTTSAITIMPDDSTS